MKIIRVIFGILICTVNLGFGGDDHDAEDNISRAFENMRHGVSVETARESFDVIRAAKEKAFPVLLAQLQRQDLASEIFQGESTNVDAAGKVLEIQAPTLGATALMLLEWEVLGSVPRGFRLYAPFDSTTAHDWFEKRKGKTLLEIKLDAARQSLKAVSQMHEAEPTRWTTETIEFYSNRITSLELLV